MTDRRIKHTCPKCNKELNRTEYINGTNFKYLCDCGYDTIMTRNNLEGKNHNQEFHRKFDHKNIPDRIPMEGQDGW